MVGVTGKSNSDCDDDGNNDCDLEDHGAAAAAAAVPPPPPAAPSSSSSSSSSSSNAQGGAGRTARTAANDCPRLVLRILQLIRRGGGGGGGGGGVDDDRIVDHLLDVARQHLDKLDDGESLRLLWDITGRLLGILLKKGSGGGSGGGSDDDGGTAPGGNSLWRTRTLAGRALEGIAGLLPREEQRRFLEEPTVMFGFQRRSISDLGDVLANAEPLLARNDDSSDTDRFDSTTELGLDPSDPDFARRRIAAQRSILRRRLGLSVVASVLDATTKSDATYDDDDILSPEDIVDSPSALSGDKGPAKKRPRLAERAEPAGKSVRRDDVRIDEDDDDDEDRHPHSLRSLLLAQLQQQQQLRSVGGNHDGHRPQRVAAHELLLHMFDPQWQVRHGAMLGTLALLRACWKSSDNALPSSALYRDSDNSTNRDNSIDDDGGGGGAVALQTWPRTVLSFSLLVLALDRFGDYSGSVATAGSAPTPTGTCTDKNAVMAMMTTSLSSSSVVAPVRELAGQVTAAIWTHYSTPYVQQEALAWLLDQAKTRTGDWEVRQGALTALKYIMALSVHQANCVDNSDAVSNGKKGYHPVVQMARAALQALSDPSDDVKSVAAQLLLLCYNRRDGVSLPLATTCIDGKNATALVYDAVRQAKKHSSCLVDLVALLAVLVRQRGQFDDEQLTMQVRVLETLTRLLDSDFTSVRESALVCVQVLARPMADAASMCGDSSGQGHSRRDLLSRFCRLVERLFETYYEQLGENEGKQGASTSTTTASSTRNDAWHEVVRASSAVSEAQNDDWKLLQRHMIFRYFGVKLQNLRQTEFTKQDEFASQMLASRALAELLCQNNAVNDPIIEISLKSFVQSPWATQCEGACLLLREIMALSPPSTESYFLSVTASLRGMLQNDCVPCVVLHDTARKLLDTEAIASTCDLAFSCAISDIEQTAHAADQRVTTLVQLWHSTFGTSSPFQVKATRSVLSMRVNATIAGTLLSDNQLPTKLTPLIRALMTSIKNEDFSSRLDRACLYVSELLRAIQDRPEFAVANRKVLDSICEIAMEEGGCDSIHHRSPGTKVLELIAGRTNSLESLKDLQPVWSRIEPLLSVGDTSYDDVDNDKLMKSIHLLKTIGQAVSPGAEFGRKAAPDFIASLTLYSCNVDNAKVRSACFSALKSLYSIDCKYLLRDALNSILCYLENERSDMSRRNASSLLQMLVSDAGAGISPFVRSLLPKVMSLMTDPVVECAQNANKTFAVLVQAAPLVQQEQSVALDESRIPRDDAVIDHLILGKPLPHIAYPKTIADALAGTNIELRPYQKEGIAWLKFLQSVNLNGALCDSMGLGE